jgi:hypothetical protein
VLFSTFIISCSDDDPQNQTLSSSDIVGNWSLVAINSTPAVDLEDDGNSDPNVMNQTDCFDGMSLDFDNNGNVSVVTSAIDFNSSATPSFTCSLQTNSGSYIINQNNLTVTAQISGNQETETLNVDVQNNTLSFIVTESDVADYFNVPSGRIFLIHHRIRVCLSEELML